MKSSIAHRFSLWAHAPTASAVLFSAAALARTQGSTGRLRFGAGPDQPDKGENDATGTPVTTCARTPPAQALPHG
jgi:hypothetical protein